MKKFGIAIMLFGLCTTSLSAQVVYCGKSTLAHYHTLLWQGFSDTIDPVLRGVNASPELASQSEEQIATCLKTPGEVYVINPIDPDDSRWQTITSSIIAIDSQPTWATIAIEYDFSIIAETLPKTDIIEVPGTLVSLQDKSQQKPKPNKDDMAGKYIFVGGHGELTKELLDIIRDAKRPASVLDISPRSVKALKGGDIDRIFQRNPYAIGQAAAQTAMDILQGKPGKDRLVPIEIIEADTLTEDLDRVHIPQGIKQIDPDVDYDRGF